MICNLGDPMILRHPVSTVRISTHAPHISKNLTWGKMSADERSGKETWTCLKRSVLVRSFWTMFVHGLFSCVMHSYVMHSCVMYSCVMHSYVMHSCVMHSYVISFHVWCIHMWCLFMCDASNHAFMWHRQMSFVDGFFSYVLRQHIWNYMWYIITISDTANPTWGDIFECCFKVQSSKLQRLFSLKRGKRDVRALSFELSKMSPQVGLAVLHHIWNHMWYIIRDTSSHLKPSFHMISRDASYGVATVSRLPNGTDLFCKRALQKRPSFHMISCDASYGVATISRLLKIIGLFCRI